MSDNVLVDKQNTGVATVTVNRPEKRNAMDVPTRRELRAAFDTLADDDNVWVIVLRGAGENSFISGADLSQTVDFDHMDGLEYVTKHAQGLYNYVADVPKPTIAAIDGYAFGGGTEISLACDIRLAQEGIKMGLTEEKVGVMPAGGGTQRLAGIVGVGIAKELIYRGQVLDANEAAEINLVNHVFAEDEFEDEVYALAEEIAEKSPIALRMAKESINRGLDLEGSLDFERMAGAFLFGTDDQKEGAKAFLEDRDPEFKGR
jgi:enoyl-CoA hydratase